MVIGCGDLPFYYLEFVVTMLDVPLYYVHGNHDHERQYMSDGRVATRAEGCISIDGELNSENGLLMAGLGGSIRYKTEGEHQYSDSEMTSRMRRISLRLLFNRYRYGRYLDLLIAHSPPFGIHDLKDPAHIGLRPKRPGTHRFSFFPKIYGRLPPQIALAWALPCLSWRCDYALQIQGDTGGQCLPTPIV